MRVNEKVLFTWVLNQLKPAPAWVKIGRRRLQTELRRICGPRVSDCLKIFCQKGYIDRSKRGHLTEPYRYRLNSTFIKTELGCQWLSLSKLIFAKESAWVKLIRVPAFSHGYLNMSGMIVFGAIVEAQSSVTTRQIQNYLSNLVSYQTVKDCLKRLSTEGLIKKNDRGQFKAVKNWEVKLYEYQEETGAKRRARKIAKDIAIQRVNFRKETERRYKKVTKTTLRTEKLSRHEIAELNEILTNDENHWTGSIDAESLTDGTLTELKNDKHCFFCGEEVVYEEIDRAACPNFRAEYTS